MIFQISILLIFYKVFLEKILKYVMSFNDIIMHMNEITTTFSAKTFTSNVNL